MKKRNRQETRQRESILKKAARTLYRKLLYPRMRIQPQTKRMLSLGTGQTEEDYYTEKIFRVTVVMIAGAALLLVMSIKGGGRDPIDVKERGDYGASAEQAVLYAETKEGEARGTYEISIEARRYTREEAEVLFEEACALLPERILGENSSLQEVRHALHLPQQLEGFPFRIDWSTDDYMHVRTDGQVYGEDLEDTGKTVTLTAQLRYGAMVRVTQITLTVLPPLYDEETLLRRAMLEALDERQRESAHEAYMPLPEHAWGERIVWYEVVSDNRPVLVILTLVIAMLCYHAPDRALKERMKKREEELAAAYPSFVSRMALYLGTGMPLRVAISRLAEREREASLKKELCLVEGWLANGVPEITAYERFGARIGLSRYTKLCALLAQNLQKGGALIPLVREEARLATQTRMDEARIRGEQTQTKLMLPMMMMLCVVMLLIMVPAFLSF